MPPTDTSEKGLESIIVGSLVTEAGYIQGNTSNYDRDHAVDIPNLVSIRQRDTAQSI